MPAVRAQPHFPSRVEGLSQLDDQYRRRARRLRHIFRRQPGRLQRSLANLATEIDDRPIPTRAPVVVRSVRAVRFEGMIRTALSAGPLRYSQRLALLKAAEAMGLGRFEANLILAIEHNREHPVVLDTPKRNWLPVSSVLLFAGIQSALIAAIWWLVQV